MSDYHQRNGTKDHSITEEESLKRRACLRVSLEEKLLSEINRRKRLKFGLQHKEKTAQYWNNVLFIDYYVPFCYLETVQRHTKTIKNKCKVYSINSNNSEWFTSSYQ
ncbi:hypothetical protein QE152_g23765 [Popillia japonica]|uniref:Uncharacterized protein n=1 Tax=Popillia japonica TaxID=7064 RepID=A0AAW1KGG7_POPJA